MSTDLVVQADELVPSSTLWGTDDPEQVIVRATKVAQTLERLVRQQGLVVRIGQSDYPRVEAWTLLGTILGVFPFVEWTRPVMEDEQKVGWEARVIARTRGGDVVGSAEAECLRSERTWKGRDDYALRSMAQTRAVSKALRLPLGFVMQLAGFDPTPAEEMPVIEARRSEGDSAAGTPFSYDHEEALDPPLEQVLAAHAASDASPTSPASEAAPTLKKGEPMWKKLNVLVGQLRDQHKLITTKHLYVSVGRELPDVTDEDLHWSPLRDSLTRQEASALIDRLEKFATERVPA